MTKLSLCFVLQCLEEHKLMRVHKVNEKVGLSQEDFVRICPSLIHQLRVGVCSKDEERASDPLQSTEDSKLLGELRVTFKVEKCRE